MASNNIVADGPVANKTSKIIPCKKRKIDVELDLSLLEKNGEGIPQELNKVNYIFFKIKKITQEIFLKYKTLF